MGSRKPKSRQPAPTPGPVPTIADLLKQDGGWEVAADRMSVSAKGVRIHQRQRSGGTAPLRLRAMLLASAPDGYSLAAEVRKAVGDLPPAKPGVEYGAVELSVEQWDRITALADKLLWAVGEENTVGVPPPAKGKRP